MYMCCSLEKFQRRSLVGVGVGVGIFLFFFIFYLLLWCRVVTGFFVHILESKNTNEFERYSYRVYTRHILPEVN